MPYRSPFQEPSKVGQPPPAVQIQRSPMPLNIHTAANSDRSPDHFRYSGLSRQSAVTNRAFPQTSTGLSALPNNSAATSSALRQQRDQRLQAPYSSQPPSSDRRRRIAGNQLGPLSQDQGFYRGAEGSRNVRENEEKGDHRRGPSRRPEITGFNGAQPPVEGPFKENQDRSPTAMPNNGDATEVQSRPPSGSPTDHAGGVPAGGPDEQKPAGSANKWCVLAIIVGVIAVGVMFYMRNSGGSATDPPVDELGEAIAAAGGNLGRDEFEEVRSVLLGWIPGEEDMD